MVKKTICQESNVTNCQSNSFSFYFLFMYNPPTQKTSAALSRKIKIIINFKMHLKSGIIYSIIQNYIFFFFFLLIRFLLYTYFRDLILDVINISNTKTYINIRAMQNFIVLKCYELAKISKNHFISNIFTRHQFFSKIVV